MCVCHMNKRLLTYLLTFRCHCDSSLRFVVVARCLTHPSFNDRRPRFPVTALFPEAAGHSAAECHVGAVTQETPESVVPSPNFLWCPCNDFLISDNIIVLFIHQHPLPIGFLHRLNACLAWFGQQRRSTVYIHVYLLSNHFPQYCLGVNMRICVAAYRHYGAL